MSDAVQVYSRRAITDEDRNRLVEEYMLIANFLVAQRLITHAGGRALLRCRRKGFN